MFVVDSHCDSIQRVDRGLQKLKNPYNMSRKHLQCQFVAMFCCWPRETPEESHARMLRYARLYEEQLHEQADLIVGCRTGREVEAALESGKNAVVMTLEGGTGLLGSTEVLEHMYSLGARVCGLTWSDNDLGASDRADPDTGLTPLGIEMAKKCLELGMLIDVSHLSDRGFYQLCELSDAPLVATHSNFRGACRHSRNLSDEMALELRRRGGMIGAFNLCRSFLREDGDPDTDDILRMTDYALSLLGDDCIGFGCDIDGTSDKYPRGITMEHSIHDDIIELLERRYPASTVERIAGGNWLDFMKKNLV